MTTFGTEMDLHSARLCATTETFYEPNLPFYTQLYPPDTQPTDGKYCYFFVIITLHSSLKIQESNFTCAFWLAT